MTSDNGNSNTKTYKNAARRHPEKPSKYVQQYQSLGVTPEEYKSPIPLGSYIAVAKNPLASRGESRHRPLVRQPYAEAVDPTLGVVKGPIPNVGNNIEQTWPGGTGDVIDDLNLDDKVDPNHPMIDNNDFVSEQALEPLIRFDETLIEGPVEYKKDEMDSVLQSLSEEEYILLVDGAPVCSGPCSFVQEQTRALVFGEHAEYKQPVSVDDIMVFKKVKIKVGVFLE